ncbi:nucleotide exchange factor GrpE [Actinomadura gamaensis]|uniref:Nucleotide exchange factor GrpE n=1 Tax=Actinomadura gamaensis TaxID=1763541 RepID=A0ABV9U2T7_9ACTN
MNEADEADEAGRPDEAHETTADNARDPKARGPENRADDDAAATASTTDKDEADSDSESDSDSGERASDADERSSGEGEDESAATSGRGADAAGTLEAVEEVRDVLRELVERFDREDGRAAHRESVIDRLHEENQRLRRGELESMLEPVRAALYKVHDTLRQAAGSAPDPEQAAKLLGGCADEVADALARTGAVRFEVEPGEPYDASRHRPMGVAEVDDPDRAGTVVAVLADGFEMGGRVVRKAGVRVGKSVKSTARRRPERDDGQRRSAR